MNFNKLLKTMIKNSIRIEYNENFEGECSVGSSKIGGKPDLPLDFNWYYYKGKTYEETLAILPLGIHKYINREKAKFNTELPLSFIAQINCSEIHEFDKDKLFPKNGMLYFFYELENMVWGSFDQKGGARVYYYPGNISKLYKRDFPLDLKEEFKLPEMPMTFINKYELPHHEEFCELHDKYNNIIKNNNIKYFELQDEYENTKIKMGFESDFDTVEKTKGKINKLLGYADIIQTGMLMDCETASKGVKLYDNKGYSDKITKKELRQYKKNCKKWQLLFQLESIKTEKYELLWNDVGKIYYYININDLSKQNFNNCWLILQC